jgi:hypothetical protein
VAAPGDYLRRVAERFRHGTWNEHPEMKTALVSFVTANW